MTDHTGSIIESQVDWLTCSAHGEAAATNLLDLARGLAREERQRGARERAFQLMGYQGAHVGRIEYGSRDVGSAMLRLIGDAANEHLNVALSACDAVTRIDLATTWRAVPPDPFIGRNTYAQAEWFHQAHPKSALPQHICDAAGGETVYLGKRESEHFLRVYNKGAECVAKHDDEGIERYLSCWRYELEIKGPRAKAVAETVDERTDAPQWVQKYIHDYLSAHEIAPPFLAEGPQALLPGFRRRSDAETKIRHLQRNVRPTVDWLREEGMLDAARKALGLE